MADQQPGMFSIALPEYELDRVLDYGALGEKVDSYVCSCFADGEYVERCVSSRDHRRPHVDEKVLSTTCSDSGTRTGRGMLWWVW